MRTTSPTRPPIRNGPATAASDIFGGLLARLYLRRLPSKLGWARTLRAARPIHFYTTAEPVVELVASRGLLTAGKARQAKHSTLH